MPPRLACSRRAAPRRGRSAPGSMPTVTSGRADLRAPSRRSTQSLTASRPTPPPMAAPSTKAITALGRVSAISSNAPKRRLEAAVASCAAIACAAPHFSMPLRSPPAQKLPPAPISTTTRTSASSRACWNVSANSRHHRRRKRVAHLGPVEGDLQHRPVAFQDQGFMGHGCLASHSICHPGLVPGIPSSACSQRLGSTRHSPRAAPLARWTPGTRPGVTRHLFRLPGRMPMCLQMMDSMISSAPPPMEPSRVSR